MVVDNKAIISYIQIQKEDLGVFRFKPKEGGQVPQYKAGQFLTLGVFVPAENKIIRRAYSIASNPENKNYIELYIRWVRKPLPGRLTTVLFSAKEGDDIIWLKPVGPFTIEDKKPDGEPDNRRIVCLGGGTGLAPFVSYAKHLHATGSKREVVVFHGASYVDELGYREELTRLEEESLDRGKDKWNFKYRATISRSDEWFNRTWNGNKGRVESFLQSKDGEMSPLEKMVGEKITKDNTVFFICGWQGTIDGCMDVLTPKGFVTERTKRADKSFEIKYESYG
ncbi:MAG: ferredoxin--NADP reductase [Nitrosopumilales archaeon]|nr:MAG: ferredoxin--NADP reductase [Nitrosopumilales archaeon]